MFTQVATLKTSPKNEIITVTKKLFRISVVAVSLLYHFKHKQSTSFGPGLLNLQFVSKRRLCFSLKKTLSFPKEVACYKGWASLEWRKGVNLTLTKSSAPSTLKQYDKSNSKRCSVQPGNLILVLLKDLKVYHTPVDLSALCSTHLNKALDIFIYNKTLAALTLILVLESILKIKAVFCSTLWILCIRDNLCY